MTGVTTGEADLTQLLGCSASDWAGVRAEARSQGRVSVRTRRQVRGVITLLHVTRLCVQTQQQSSLAELVTRCEAEEAGQVTRGWTEAAHSEGGQAQPRPAGRDVRETFIKRISSIS